MSGVGVVTNRDNQFSAPQTFKAEVKPQDGITVARVSVAVSKTLTVLDIGTEQNVSASDTATAISITLPAASSCVGRSISLSLGVSVPTTVAPAGTDRILPAAATVPISNGASGSALVLLSQPQGWVRKAVTGTWS